MTAHHISNFLDSIVPTISHDECAPIPIGLDTFAAEPTEAELDLLRPRPQGGVEEYRETASVDLLEYPVWWTLGRSVQQRQSAAAAPVV
jgi:hypothetical protein